MLFDDLSYPKICFDQRKTPFCHLGIGFAVGKCLRVNVKWSEERVFISLLQQREISTLISFVFARQELMQSPTNVRRSFFVQQYFWRIISSLIFDVSNIRTNWAMQFHLWKRRSQLTQNIGERFHSKSIIAMFLEGHAKWTSREIPAISEQNYAEQTFTLPHPRARWCSSRSCHPRCYHRRSIEAIDWQVSNRSCRNEIPKWRRVGLFLKCLADCYCSFLDIDTICRPTSVSVHCRLVWSMRRLSASYQRYSSRYTSVMFSKNVRLPATPRFAQMLKNPSIFVLFDACDQNEDIERTGVESRATQLAVWSVSVYNGRPVRILREEWIPRRAIVLINGSK